MGICYHDNRWVSTLLYYLVIKQTVNGRRKKEVFEYLRRVPAERGYKVAA